MDFCIFKAYQISVLWNVFGLVIEIDEMMQNELRNVLEIGHANEDEFWEIIIYLIVSYKT